ncbi:MAG: Crp/Fnr family transcriptional regulator [Spirochaetales bacterium]|nr:Crp/Fnr family transcriptional regulator [Spirochaetales bacterium]
MKKNDAEAVDSRMSEQVKKADNRKKADEVLIMMLRKHALFSGLSDAVLAQLASSGKKRQFKKGETLHTPYDSCREYTLVITGAVQVVRIIPGDRELIMRHVKRGETYGEVLALAEKPYPGWVRAAEDGSIVELPVEMILSYCDDPVFSRKMVKEIARTAACMSDKVDILAAASLEERFLLYLSNEMNRRPPAADADYDIKLSLTKTDLAKQLGCSREALSRTMHGMMRKGVIQMSGSWIRFPETNI